MKALIKFMTVLMLMVLATQGLWAGGANRIGTAGAQELLIPVGARGISLGGSTIATTSGIEALFWNPAGITKSATATNFLFSHMSYIADIGVEYGAVSVNFEGLGIVALTLKSLSIGDIPVTTEENPDGTGQTYSPQYFTTGLTFAKQLSDRISVGITANMILERLGQVNSSGVAFNAGVMYDNLASLSGLSVGVVVKNIGPQMSFDGPGLYRVATVSVQSRGPQYYTIETAPFELPSTIEIGLGYRLAMNGESGLLLSSTFQNSNFSDDEYKIGAEYSFNKAFFVRGGWTFAPNIDNADYLFGPTAGAGIVIENEGTAVAVDYAFRSTQYFSGGHVISVRIGF